MATMVTRGGSPLASSMSSREKGNRNKRKFRADPPFADSNILNPPPYTDCINYDFFPMEKAAENSNMEQHTNFCDVCRTLSCDSKEAIVLEEPHEVDWSNLTENELEKIILNNLDEIFNGAIKTITSYGYSEEIATNAVLSYGICYRCKYTVSNIVDNALLLLRSGREVESAARENAAENIQMLARNVLADMVSVLRAVRPFFSSGDAMWCLLLCDLNVSHACAVACDGPSTTCHEEKSSTSIAQPQSNSEPLENGTISTSQIISEADLSVSRKNYHVTSSKRESILRDKQFQFDDYRASRSKAALRASKHLEKGRLLLDEKAKSVSDPSAIGLKCTSTKSSKAVGLDSPQIDGSFGFSLSDTTPVGPSVSLKASCSPASLAVANTELSLSLLPSTSSSTGYEIRADKHRSSTGMGSEKYGNLIPQDKKDDLLLKLFPRVRELEAQKKEWTEWAQHKVMQAAHRLSKDKPELQTLRQEKEDVARLKKEKKTLEENTKKKLIEMENALSKASFQIEEANVTAHRLDIENLELRKEMEAAQLRAVESALSCQEVSKRQRNILNKFQSWDREKSLLQEELVSEKRMLLQLQQQFKDAKEHHDLVEIRWKQEHKAKTEVLSQLKAVKTDRERIEASGKSKENEMMIEAENDHQKSKDDIRRLERQISQLRSAMDAMKITSSARWGDQKLADRGKNSFYSQSNIKILDPDEDLERERECVMCMSEEMSVVFLPCAHQIVCASCNALHERQGMKDCPSCRTAIQRRITVRFAEFTG